MCDAQLTKKNNKRNDFFSFIIQFFFDIFHLSMARFETTWLHKLFSTVLLNFVLSALGFF